MKKYIYLSALIPMIMISGCQNKKKPADHNNTLQINKNSATHTGSIQPTHKKQPQQSTISITPADRKNPLGIEIRNGKIIIDTNQTKNFLDSVGRQLDNGFRKIEKDLRKNQIKTPNETGVIITDDKMEIDLNKSRNFMKKWMKSMEGVAKELDRTMRDIEKSLPKQ